MPYYEIENQATGRYDYYNKEDQLYDWACATECGVMGMGYDNIPTDCINFIMSQYERFKIPLPSCIDQVMDIAATWMFTLIDQIDPYMLFWGLSDVNLTGDWCECAFEVHAVGEPVREVDPEWVETFIVDLAQGERLFYEYLSKPGLQALPVGEQIREMLDGDCGDSIYESFNKQASAELEKFCLVKNAAGEDEVDTQRFRAYFELAAWATFVWIAGPPSRQFRSMRHEIFSACFSYGECILAEGVVIPPTHYVKLPRAPRSCYKCGINSWCVELTQDEAGGARRICEHCLNHDMPKFNGATCGTKFCRRVECQHNPYNGSSTGLRDVYKGGQLFNVAGGKSPLATMGAGQAAQALLPGA